MIQDGYLTYPYPNYDERKPVFQQGVFYIPEYYPLKNQYALADFDLQSHVQGKKRVVIEFCSGTGDWIVGCANENRDVQYVAVERKFKRVCKIAEKRDSLGLDNLLIICGNAEHFVKYFVKEPTFAKVYVNFPDPWPKKRHEKHRLFSSDFVADLSKTLLFDAGMLLVTDDYDFVQHAKSTLLEKGQWDYTLLESSDIASYGESYFHKLWLSKGRNIYFNQFDYLGFANPELKETHKALCVDIDLSKPNIDIKSSSIPIMWCLDLGLKEKPAALSWEAYIQNLSVKVEHFLASLSDDIFSKTYGFSLFKGFLEMPAIPFDVQTFKSFEEVESQEKLCLSSFNTFSLLLFAKLLNEFVPLFPEDKPLFLLFSDVDKALTKLEVLSLTSKETLPYFQCVLPEPYQSVATFNKDAGLVSINQDANIKCAFVFPSINAITPSVATQLEAAIDKLDLPVKVISECVLNEEWEGIEKLIYVDSAVSAMGKRMIKGFKLGGGEVVCLDEEFLATTH